MKRRKKERPYGIGLYSGISGNHVVPMRARPRARKYIPWRGRLSVGNGWAMSKLGQYIATLFGTQVFTESKPAMSVSNCSSDE